MRNEAQNHDPSELGDLERELLHAVWHCGEATADALRTKLTRNLKDSTIRTVLRRLEDKGYLTHETVDRTYIYRPIQSRLDVAARAVRHIAEWFCHGSVEELLVGVVDAKVLSGNELQQLSKRISEAKKAGAK